MNPVGPATRRIFLAVIVAGIFGIYPPDDDTKRRYEESTGIRPRTHG